MLTWGFTIDSEAVLDLVRAFEQRKKEETGEFIDWDNANKGKIVYGMRYKDHVFDMEYLTEIFDLPEEYSNHSINIDVLYREEVEVTVYDRDSLGSVEAWGYEWCEFSTVYVEPVLIGLTAGSRTMGFGAAELQKDLKALKTAGAEALEQIKKHLRLKEAGVTVEEECLVILSGG
jgi:hypothetical protein